MPVTHTIIKSTFFHFITGIAHCERRQGIWSLDTEANSCTVSAASAKSLQDDFFTGDRRDGKGTQVAEQAHQSN